MDAHPPCDYLQASEAERSEFAAINARLKVASQLSLGIQ